MAELACTSGQTVGHFLSLGLPYPGDSDLVGGEHPHAVRLHGTVYDGAGEAVPDASPKSAAPRTVSTSICRARTRPCSWRTGTIGDDQSVVARRPAGGRAHDGSGAAGGDGRGGIRLVGQLLAGLEVHSGRMAENLRMADVYGEQREIADLVGKAPSATYVGAANRLIDESLDRAERILKTCYSPTPYHRLCKCWPARCAPACRSPGLRGSPAPPW
jgi:hypothetical protein